MGIIHKYSDNFDILQVLAHVCTLGTGEWQRLVAGLVYHAQCSRLVGLL